MTPLSLQLPDLIKAQRTTVFRGTLKNIEYRKQLLRQLQQLLRKHEDEILEAIFLDFKKPHFESLVTELGPVHHEINICLRNMDRWSKKKRVKTTPLSFPARSYVFPEPYGHCLIIGAWNYPVQLTLQPLVTALAAGNVCLLKPSELTTQSSRVIAKLINTNFKADELHVVEGGVMLAQELLSYKFDKIFFTGSTKVGKVIAAAAAKHLTPTLLELGGKSPCLILPDADLDLAAKRIAWGKFINAGQTCIAPDYIYIHASLHQVFLEKLKAEIQKQFGPAPDKSPHFARIVNTEHTERLCRLLTQDKVFFGGDVNKDENYIGPTLLTNIDFSDDIMQEEIFGPLLPVLSWTDLQAALDTIKNQAKPLAFYIFTKDKKAEETILSQVSFGGACINDVLMHIANSNFPFGGIGESGMGHYHGEYGFKNLSHFKPVLRKMTSLELPIRYPPYSLTKFKIAKRFIKWF